MKIPSRKIISIIAVTLLAVAAVYCIFRIAGYAADGYQSAQWANSVGNSVQIDNPAQAAGNQSGPAPAQALQNGYESIQDISPDAAGWVYIPGTDIKYPVVQGKDNSYYTTHDIKRQESTHGSIFLDYRDAGDLSGLHTVLYGHNMKDGSMFGHLTLYESEAYYRDHPDIQLTLRGQDSSWKIFSVFTSNDEAVPVQFSSQADFAGYLESLPAKSIYNTGVVPAKNDRLLTLSTCSHEYNDARFVVCAIRTDEPNK